MMICEQKIISTNKIHKWIHSCFQKGFSIFITRNSYTELHAFSKYINFDNIFLYNEALPIFSNDPFLFLRDLSHHQLMNPIHEMVNLGTKQVFFCGFC